MRWFFDAFWLCRCVDFRLRIRNDVICLTRMCKSLSAPVIHPTNMVSIVLASSIAYRCSCSQILQFNGTYFAFFPQMLLCKCCRFPFDWFFVFVSFLCVFKWSSQAWLLRLWVSFYFMTVSLHFSCLLQSKVNDYWLAMDEWIHWTDFNIRMSAMAQWAVYCILVNRCGLFRSIRFNDEEIFTLYEWMHIIVVFWMWSVI